MNVFNEFGEQRKLIEEIASASDSLYQKLRLWLQHDSYVSKIRVWLPLDEFIVTEFERDEDGLASLVDTAKEKIDGDLIYLACDYSELVSVEFGSYELGSGATLRDHTNFNLLIVVASRLLMAQSEVSSGVRNYLSEQSVSARARLAKPVRGEDWRAKLSEAQKLDYRSRLRELTNSPVGSTIASAWADVVNAIPFDILGQSATDELKASFRFAATAVTTGPAKTLATSSDTVTNQFSITELCKACGGISNETLAKYGKQVTESWAKRGQRNFKFSLSEALNVVAAVKDGSQDSSVRISCDLFLTKNQPQAGSRPDLDLNLIR